jgi:chaperonin cofactor prefoldin
MAQSLSTQISSVAFSQRACRTISLTLVLALAAPAAELPVKQVTLYKHGVAAYERSGDLKPGETVQLNFKPEEMNDVLKSLTITDRNGGKVSGVRYDSNEPLGKRLGDYPFAVGGSTSLAAFLDQVKGARLELRLGAEVVTGVIVSSRVVPGTTESEVVLLLMDSGDIRKIDLGAASSVKFPEAKLQQQFRDYLAVLSNVRGNDRRSVFIDGTSGGTNGGMATRAIVANYMTPAPVWKSSYRLMFPAPGSADSSPALANPTLANPTLEGWAIIDNTSGEDWKDVKLSVVSGKPVSFITELYEPKYVTRPRAELAENRAAAPLVYDGAIAKVADAENRAFAAPPPALQLRGRGAGMAAGIAAAPVNAVQESTISSTATGQQAGELFEYSFPQLVNVKKGESAMLPFLQQKLGARKLLIYSESYGLNPRDAAELTNNTGKTLDGGPITVYDAGAYAGEALVETLPIGDKRLISYGVDLGTRVTTAFDSSAAVVREVHINRGSLLAKSAIQETKTYTIRNVDARAKTLIIEQPQRPGYRLLEPKAVETTASTQRFEVKLAASSVATLKVKEEYFQDEEIVIRDYTPDQLTIYLQNPSVTPAMRQQLQQVMTKKNEVAANQAAAKQVDADIAGLDRDQARIRQNIESLNRVSGQQDQVQQYARQLAAAESRLATLRDSQNDLRKKQATLEAELNTLILRLDF